MGQLVLCMKLQSGKVQIGGQTPLRSPLAVLRLAQSSLVIGLRSKEPEPVLQMKAPLPQRHRSKTPDPISQSYTYYWLFLFPLPAYARQDLHVREHNLDPCMPVPSHIAHY